MNEQTQPRPAFGIQAKLFLLVLVSFGVLMFVISSTISTKANQTAEKEIARSLSQAGEILHTRFQSRFEDIRIKALNMARDAQAYPAVVARDDSTLQDLAEEFQKTLQFDILMITDDEGTLLARPDRPELTGRNLAGRSRLIDGALSGQSGEGFMKSGNRVLQIVSVPVEDNVIRELIRGTVAVAYPVTQSLVDEIQGLTECSVGVFALDADEEGNPYPVTFNETEDLAPLSLDRFFTEHREYWTQLLDTAPGSQASVRFTIANEVYHAVLFPLTSSSGSILGFTAALRSHTELVRPFMQIRTATLAASFGCVLGAALLAFLIARRISRPIIRLVSVTEEIKQGVYEPREAGGRRDEVGLLQAAVHRMGKELKEKADLESYLAGFTDLFTSTPGEEASQTMQDSHLAKAFEAHDRPVNVDAPTLPARVEQETIPSSHIDAEDGLQESPDKPLRPGQLPVGSVFANRYEIIRELGSGAMGSVYLAMDQDLDERIALKTISSPLLQGRAIDMLKQELKLARRIAHPNVVKNFDFSSFEGQHYISMEYVPGYTLGSLIKEHGEVPIHLGIMLSRQMCSAVHAAHLEGIVHRDLKPANMMINPRGILKIMDFGVASSTSDLEELRDAGKTVVTGTPLYMSPEQFEGKDVDERTDIYALGVILFFLFSARHPFEGKGLRELKPKHLDDDPPHLNSILTTAPAALDEVIQRALAKDRAERFPNALSMEKALSAIQL